MDCLMVRCRIYLNSTKLQSPPAHMKWLERPPSTSLHDGSCLISIESTAGRCRFHHEGHVIHSSCPPCQRLLDVDFQTNGQSAMTGYCTQIEGIKSCKIRDQRDARCFMSRLMLSVSSHQCRYLPQTFVRNLPLPLGQSQIGHRQIHPRLHT